MPSPLIPLILSAGTQLGSSFLASRTARKNTESTIQANKELAQYAYSQDQLMAEQAYQRDIAMWERQNAYNSPESQMERLKAAGLNPNLIYGTGTVAGMQSGPPPKFNPAQYRPPNVEYRNLAMEIPSVIGEYQNFQMRQAQIDNVKANTENVHARTINESFRKLLLEFGARTSEFDLERRSDLAPFQQTITENQARQSGIDVASAVQRLQLMNQDQVLKDLETRYREKGLYIQQIDAERKQADLLFSQYRNEWMKMGVTGGDNVILRVLVRMLNESGMSDLNLFGK